MTSQAAAQAIERVCQALAQTGRNATADASAAQKLDRGRKVVLTVTFSAEHMRHCESQRQQYSSWGWDTPSIDAEVRLLDQAEHEAILTIVRRMLPDTVIAAPDQDHADLAYGVARHMSLTLQTAS